MWVLLRKEFFTFFNSLIAFLVIGSFLVMTGLLMWVFPETSVLEYGYADMDTFFSFTPYLFIFLIPGITMRSFAEEKKSGTLELLITRPLTDWQIVTAKFFAAWLLVAVALLPTLVYFISLYKLGDPPGNIDSPGVAGSYVGLLMLASVFCAAGILASLLSTNQIVAFVLAAFFCFLLFSGFDSFAALMQWSELSLRIKQFGLLYHYEAMSRGVIDSRDLIYILSLTAVLLLTAKTLLSSRTW
ncbi:MAG: gliding motility-associated ABC transporter permease subunit GldF [Cyclobacteriaceae bacterium]|nr:gliding motility-associated ABC transporter permease subunit GldF [Cyclobacteriaceae bacterium]MCX7636531.1 gliding motility-associated ABC transporter permease subunit GldF [Cyclobacteriaceae bacterium]MDW8330106.1 gliding motility-associated ABC transporter permease subunit GldF [Cyclobacteriaceae bacterium]